MEIQQGIYFQLRITRDIDKNLKFSLKKNTKNPFFYFFYLQYFLLMLPKNEFQIKIYI